MLALPFPINAKVIELGGDINNPHFRPNVNCTPGPAVDFVCDLNERFPFEDGICDGILGSYVIEHIKHCNLRQFISECNRILTPNGAVLMITANLLNQARKLVEKPIWDDDDIYMVFGGKPDFEGNYHHTGFSPEFAERLFKEAGFKTVKIEDYPQCFTDMVLSAWK